MLLVLFLLFSTSILIVFVGAKADFSVCTYLLFNLIRLTFFLLPPDELSILQLDWSEIVLLKEPSREENL